eukprot:scaffold36955_cov69-Phaeocystis_antarctica.AAC.9
MARCGGPARVPTVELQAGLEQVERVGEERRDRAGGHRRRNQHGKRRGAGDIARAAAEVDEWLVEADAKGVLTGLAHHGEL